MSLKYEKAIAADNCQEVSAEFTLVDGVFTLEEARELLLSLYGTKIQFHETRNFSSLERFGYELEKDQSRIVALKLAREGIKKILNDTKEYNRFVIKSTIEIKQC